jgi:anti-anti-sigma regulatory factor
MNMNVEQTQARVPVTILRLHGDVDGSNYRTVIDRARELYQAGARYLLIDLADTPYMSSAGLVALRSIAVLYLGNQPPDLEDGWRAIRAVTEVGDSGAQPHVKLLNPQPRITTVLDQTGLMAFFEIHTDQASALASF